MTKLVDGLKTAARTLQALISPRDAALSRYREMLAEFEAIGRADQPALAEKQRAFDEWERPRRELERLKAEVDSRSTVIQQRLGAAEREVRDNMPAVLLGFIRWLARIRTDWQPVALETTRNQVTDEVVATNGAAVEANQRLLDLVLAAGQEAHTSLWKAPDAVVRERIAFWREAIEAAAAGDLPGGEPRQPGSRPSRPGGYARL